MIPSWLRYKLDREGWSANPEWSAPGEMGQMYVLEKGKFKVRIPEEAISAFLEGFSYGKLNRNNDQVAVEQTTGESSS